jgi:hypothetical protein
MPRVNHAFAVSAQPADAQQQFIEHVLPRLHELGGFVRTGGANGTFAYGAQAASGRRSAPLGAHTATG